jgi:hypothetical protein
MVSRCCSNRFQLRLRLFEGSHHLLRCINGLPRLLGGNFACLPSLAAGWVLSAAQPGGQAGQADLDFFEPVLPVGGGVRQICRG